MSKFKVNHIKSKSGKNGPVLAGITTVSSTGAMRIPSGATGSAYGSGNADVVNDNSLVVHVDVAYSYNSNHPGTLYDLSGRNHNFVLHGTTKPVYNSSNGGSLVFSESNVNFGAASIGNHELQGGYNGPFTYEAWFYSTATADYEWVLGTGPDDYTGLGSHSTSFMFGRNGGGGNLIKYISGKSTNTWYHVVQRLNNSG